MTQAQRLAEAGKQLVLFNEPDKWKEEFIAFIERSAQSLPFFKLEDIRADWLAKGNPPPHHSNVYGAIGSQIEKRGIGKFVGYVKSVSPKTHGHPVAQYRSLKFIGAANE